MEEGRPVDVISEKVGAWRKYRDASEIALPAATYY